MTAESSGGGSDGDIHTLAEAIAAMQNAADLANQAQDEAYRVQVWLLLVAITLKNNGLPVEDYEGVADLADKLRRLYSQGAHGAWAINQLLSELQ